MPAKRTTYKSSNCKVVVWNKASTIRGKNPKTTRKDPYGNQISFCSYGKTTKSGWQIDHIKPQSKGGSHDIRNLQALQSKMNNKKSDSQVKKSRHSK
jgi:5-methylcytosine-specific restriction endonuclease McrA